MARALAQRWTTSAARLRQIRRRLSVDTSRRHVVRWLFRLLVYLVLVDVAFVFLFPLLYMVTTSFKTVQDLVDPTVYWVPREIHWVNYNIAFWGLHYQAATAISAFISLAAAAGATASAAFVGYGLARSRFPGRDLVFALIVFGFVVPPQTIIVPIYLLYKQLGWLDSYLPLVVPAFFASGIRGSLFVLVLRQFFRNLPWEVEEAARVDGAGALTTYWRIMLPLAKPAVVVVFLFSLVWSWNDAFLSSIFISTADKFTLPMRLTVLSSVIQSMSNGSTQGQMSPTSQDLFNEAVLMAACLLVILPLLLVYVVAQRWFVDSIDRTGLVE